MKFLWRAKVARIARPIYLVAHNLQSAQAMASNHPQVAPTDVLSVQRIDEWLASPGRTTVLWPEPPPEPDPDWPPTP